MVATHFSGGDAGDNSLDGNEETTLLMATMAMIDFMVMKATTYWKVELETTNFLGMLGVIH